MCIRDRNYTTRGLAKICKEGVDAIGGALRELESAGYIVRHQMRDRQGRISDTEYAVSYTHLDVYKRQVPGSKIATVAVNDIFLTGQQG